MCFEVKKVIDFGALWAGAGGRGRGSSASDSEILTKDSARPAPPEGGAANIYGLRLCRRPLFLHIRLYQIWDLG